MLLISYIQQYFNTSITVLTNHVWKLLIALFKVPNTGAFIYGTWSEYLTIYFVKLYLYQIVATQFASGVSQILTLL